MCCRILIVGLLLFAVASSDDLIFLQTVWSNGARNPTRVCKNDNNNASQWVQGFGALSQVGMAEQFHVGETIFNDYASSTKFLSSVYRSDEIYIRSSDDRSTISGAYSNLLGMYFNRPDYRPDDDYPNIVGWPPGFVPVAVHVTEPTTDFAVNYGSVCSRYDLLINNLKASPEYSKYAANVKDSLGSISAACGETIDVLGVWVVAESMNAELRDGKNNVITDPALRSLVKDIYAKSETFKYGLGVNATYRTELGKVKGGNLLWNMIDHMDLKITCLGETNKNLCHWMKPLNYYAYSTDISMLRSLLVALGADDLLSQTFPNNYGAVILELWNSTNGFQIKMKFHSAANSSFVSTTENIGDCRATASGYCSLADFKKRSAQYAPDNIKSSCAMPLNISKNAVASNQNRANVAQQSDGAKLIEEGTDTLLFVQAVWRHGDRSPVADFVCPNDPNQESSWKQGFDQLSFRGMQQHFTFGSMIFNRYADGKFLSQKYNSAEMHVRSTDYNRTIISAISNLMGLYYNKGQPIPGVDYPSPQEVPRWPQGYVPIPIHTIVREDEYMADIPAPPCPRKYRLQDLGYETEEISRVIDKNKELISNLTTICGRNMSMNALHGPVDTWFAEDIVKKPKLFDTQMYNKLKWLDNKAEDVKAGQIAYFPFAGDIDLSIELPKIRGGPLLWHLIDNIDLKIKCAAEGADSTECTKMKTLKYYIYSSHDITLLALLSALEVRDYVILAGIPNYSAGLLFELWKTSAGFEIRVLFHRIVNETFFEDITGLISGCPEGTRCPLEMFRSRSLPFKVDDILKLCYDMPVPGGTTASSAQSTSGNTKGTASASALSVLAAAASLVVSVAFMRR